MSLQSIMIGCVVAILWMEKKKMGQQNSSQKMIKFIQTLETKFSISDKNIYSTSREELIALSSNGNAVCKLVPIAVKQEPQEINIQDIIKQEKIVNMGQNFLLHENPNCNVPEDEASNDDSFHLSWDDDMFEEQQTKLPASIKSKRRSQEDLCQKIVSEPRKKRRRKRVIYSRRRKLKTKSEVENYMCTVCSVRCSSKLELKKHLDICTLNVKSSPSSTRALKTGGVKSTPSLPRKELRGNACPSCRLVETGCSQADQLRLQGHLNSRKLKFSCLHCTFTCFCGAYLDNHVKTTHAASSEVKDINFDPTDTDKIEESLNKAPKRRSSRCKRRKDVNSSPQQKVKNGPFDRILDSSNEGLQRGHSKKVPARSMKVKQCYPCNLVRSGGSKADQLRQLGHLNSRKLKYSCQQCDFACFCKAYMEKHVKISHDGPNEKIIESSGRPVFRRRGAVIPDLDFSEEETDTSSEVEEFVSPDDIDTGQLEEPLIEASKMKAWKTIKIKNSPLQKIWSVSSEAILDDFNDTLLKDPERDPLEESFGNSSKDQGDIRNKKEVIWNKVVLTDWSDDLITYSSLSDSDSKVSSGRRYNCVTCCKVFLTKRGRYIHSQKHHMPRELQKQSGKLIRSNGNTMHFKIDGVYTKCPHCDFVTNDSNFLREHLVMMHNLPYCYICPFCYFKGPNNAIITAHVILDHSCGAEDVCIFCEHNYANLTHNHRLNFDRSNLGVRPYYCSGCDFICTNDNNFIQHVISEHVGN